MLWFGAGVATATLPNIKEKRESGKPHLTGTMHHYSTKITTIRAPHSSQATNQHLVIVHGDRTLNRRSVAIYGKTRSATHTVLKIASYSVVSSFAQCQAKQSQLICSHSTQTRRPGNSSSNCSFPPESSAILREEWFFFVCKSNHSLTHYNVFRIRQSVLQDTTMSSGSGQFT